MTEPARKIGVANLGTVYNQTNHITIKAGQEVALNNSDPLPELCCFQGRKDELANLNTWLADSKVSMIGVRGEGGIGKSTLVAKAFSDCSGFAGKLWVDVRTGTSITELATRALKEFGVLPEQVDAIEEKNLVPSLLRRLQTGRYLLAIDNLETVLSPTGEWQSGYESFLDGFQDLGGQSVLLMAGREYPPKYFGWRRSRWLAVEEGLTPSEGAALLESLEVADTPENRAEVSEQVQGNPLALYLIAGWLRNAYRQSKERLVCHLSQHTDLFQVEDKHRISVDRVMEWSMDRLTTEQQQTLTQMSVFRGGFNAEAAMAVVAVPEKTVSDADLEDLERRSLLQLLPERDKYGLQVFRLQSRVREFVQKRTDDLTDAHERAVVYFWEHRQTELPVEGTLANVAEYEETFYHLCQLGRYRSAARVVFACDDFLRRRGYYQTLLALYNKLHSDWQPTLKQRKDYAVVCSSLGLVYDSLGQYEQTIILLQQSLEIAREIGDQQVAANSLSLLGDTHDSLGRYEGAITLLLQSLEIAREIGDRQIEAVALGNLGSAYCSLGQYERAIDLFQKYLDIAREIGDRWGEADSLLGLGNSYYALGQYAQAIAFHQKCLDIRREIGDRRGEAGSLGNLGILYRLLGQYDLAIELFKQHLEIAKDIGDRRGEASALGNLGNVYDSLGQHEQAIDHHHQSLEIERDIGNRQGEADSLNNLGIACGSLGQYERAIAFHQQSLDIKRTIRDREGEGTGLFNIGVVLSHLDRHYESLQSFEQSLAICEELKLEHRIEECKAAIVEHNKIIAAQQRSTSTIAPDQLSIPQRPTTEGLRMQRLWLCFIAGLALALLIWWLQQS